MNPICHHQLSTVINSRPVSSIYTPDFLPAAGSFYAAVTIPSLISKWTSCILPVTSSPVIRTGLR